MNSSILPIIAASISFSVGVFFMFGYFLRFGDRKYLTYALTTLLVSAFSIATFSLYSSSSVEASTSFIRVQVILYGLIIVSLLYFFHDYTQKPIRLPSKGIAAVILILIAIEMFDRSNLTQLTSAESIKKISLGEGSLTYYLSAPGIVTNLLLIIGVIVCGWILISVIFQYRKSHKISDLLMVIGVGILYIGILNDILVINHVYSYYYLLEYAYLFTVIVMGVSLSQIIYEGLNVKKELVSNNIDLQRIKTYLERSVQESVAETISQKRYFEALVEYSPIAIVSLDLNENIINCNPSFEQLFGYKEDEILGKNLDTLINPSENLNEAFGYTQKAINKQFVHFTATRYRKDHSPVEVEVRGVSVAVDGKDMGILALYEDITERKKVEQILRENEASYRSLFEDSPISLWEEDFSEVKQGIDLLKKEGITNFQEYFSTHPETVRELTSKILVVNINQATVDLFKAENKQTIFSGLNTVLGIDSVEVLANELAFFAEGNLTFSSEIEQKRFDGEIFTAVIRLAIAPGYEENWSKVFVSIIDISDRIKNEKLLQYLSTHDSLTNLPNRVLLYDRIQHAINLSKRTYSRLAVLFLDLDGFKSVNDTYGHQAGDEILIAVAKRIKGSFRESDTLARIGGDEFVLVLENIDGKESLICISEKILNLFKLPFQIHETDIYLNTSIGVSMYSQDGDTPETLVQSADQAMYTAKQDGKGKYYFAS